MDEPRAGRPLMPGYGIDESIAGLLPWSWAEDHLRRSFGYWLASVRPDGRPHVMPVWAVWHDDALWFSSARSSRKARNLAADERCTITTDDVHHPVVVDGRAHRMVDPGAIASFAAAVNGKYDVDYAASFYDPATTAVFVLTPETVIALDDERFAESPTRWRCTDVPTRWSHSARSGGGPGPASLP